MDLIMWWNLPFVLPFVAALGYLLLSATGVVSFEHGDADVDADADLDHDLDHGVEHSVDHDTDHESGLGARALSFLGLGRVPLSILIMSFCLVWGFVGWALNRILSGVLFFPPLYFPVSFTGAALVSVFFTGRLARVMGRAMPASETYTVAPAELVGQVAEVRWAVMEHSGTAMLYDRYRAFKEVECRVGPGEDPLAPGTKVVLMQLQSDGAYLVRRDPIQSLRITN